MLSKTGMSVMQRGYNGVEVAQEGTLGRSGAIVSWGKIRSAVTRELLEGRFA
jgi:hypothetical protein